MGLGHTFSTQLGREQTLTSLLLLVTVQYLFLQSSLETHGFSGGKVDTSISFRWSG